jgi:hypothetical protein
MANKLARIAWVVLNRQEPYRRGITTMVSKTGNAGFGLSTVTEPISAASQGSSMNSLRSALTSG